MPARLLGTSTRSRAIALSLACALSVTLARAATTPAVVVTEATVEGMACFKIATPSATYFYDKAGAGLARLVDRDGNEWIGFRRGGGAAGHYRGIPNMGLNAFGHPGYTGAVTTTKDRLRVQLPRFTLTSKKDSWHTTWAFFPTHAEMTVQAVGAKSWYLYEGTPGGAIGGDDVCGRSDGAKSSCDTRWTGDIKNTTGAARGAEWLYFADGKVDRSLFMIHKDDDLVDSYYRMGPMTVFGFGRAGMARHITRTPDRLVIGLVETRDFARVGAHVDAAWTGRIGAAGKRTTSKRGPTVRPIQPARSTPQTPRIALSKEARGALADMDFPRVKRALEGGGGHDGAAAACDAMRAVFEGACARIDSGAWKPNARAIVGMRGTVTKASREGATFRGSGLSMRRPWRSLKPEQRVRFLSDGAPRGDAGAWVACLAYAVLSGAGERSVAEIRAAKPRGVDEPAWLRDEGARAPVAGPSVRRAESPRARSNDTTPPPVGWPQWRGPGRDGVSPEQSGYAGGAWLSSKPRWTAEVGDGSASVVVADGRAYSLGNAGGRDTVYCIDAQSGRVAWKQSYPCAQYGRFAIGDKGQYRGPSASPVYDGETKSLYTQSLDGELVCWDAATGARRWRVNHYDAFGVKRRPSVKDKRHLRDFGYTSSPLVVGETLVAEVGSPRGTFVAFDKRTGAAKWFSDITEPAGHTGGVVGVTVGSKRCVAALCLTKLVVVSAESGSEGKTVATYPWKTDYACNISTPAVAGDRVILTSGYNMSSTALVRITPRGATKVWQQRHFSKVGSPVVHGGRVYVPYTRLMCLDLATGNRLWQGGRFGEDTSCLVAADGRVIVAGSRPGASGCVALVEGASRSRSQYAELACRTDVFRTRAKVWPHVAFADGRVYCKNSKGSIVCFDVAGR